MNRCDKYEKIMQDVLDGAASDRDREALDRHMSQCRTCRSTFKALTFSLDMLAAMPVSAPTPDFTARTVLGAFRARELRTRRRKFFSWSLVTLMALFSTLLATGWPSVIWPVARVGLLGLLGIFRDVIILCTVFDKLQSVLADIMSLVGDAALRVALDAGVPVLFGCLTALCLMLFIIIHSGLRVPDVLVKRR